MTRYLTILGVAFAAVVAAAALTTNDAGAVEEITGPAYFEAEAVESGTAKIDGEDIGETTAISFELGELVCSTIKYDGKPKVAGPTTETPVIIEPKYEKCHSLTPLGTKTTTVTMNGCVYEVEPTATITEGGEEHFQGLTDIVCPAGKAIEVHVYNTTAESDSGASTLCTFDVPAQSDLSGITLTNQAGSPGDIVADFNIESIAVTRTTGVLCGPEKQTAVYEGQATLRATNESSEFITVLTNTLKRFQFNMPTPTVLAEKGKAEIQTEKELLVCNSVKYEGEPKVQSTPALSLKPTYSDCKFGTKKADVKFNGCEYQFTPTSNFHNLGGGVRNTTAKMKILCGKVGPITIEVTDTNEKKICTLTIGTNEALTGVVDMINGHKVEPTDPKENYITFKHTLGGIEYEVKDEPNTCGKNEKLKNATLKGEIVVHSYDHAKKQNGIRVVGINEHVVKP